MKFTIIGLNEKIYVADVCYGHNCDFEYGPTELTKYILYLRGDDNNYYRLVLEEEFGECGSGWTTASWGYAFLERIEHIGPFGYKPKEKYTFEVEKREDGSFIIDALDREDGEEYGADNLVAGVFSFSFDGGDSYYPCGGIYVNFDKFEQLPRAMHKRPVWIFKGPSSLGKSTLAYNFEELSVFETDSVEVLPDSIIEDVIVLGNKGNFTVDDVKKRIFGDPKIIVVDFKEDPLCSEPKRQ